MLSHEISRKRITLYSDSQAAIRALASVKICSKLVLECSQKLNSLGVKNIVTLRWTPGHSGVYGNEEADAPARKGAETCYFAPEPACGIPISSAKGNIKKWLVEERTKRWKNVRRQKQAKYVVVGPCINKSRELLNETRSNVKNTIAILTGHCRLNKYLFNLGLVNTPICRKCHNCDETPYHLLCECVVLKDKRFILFGKDELIGWK